MFLRLPAVVAGGRALGALSCVLASMSGHAAMGHHHMDVPRAAFAFLMLLAASWRTSDVRWLLVAGQASQLIVHGGVSIESLPMLLMHTLFGISAALLVWRVEAVWQALLALLEPLRRAVALIGISVDFPPRVGVVRWPHANRAPSSRLPTSLSGRAPPVLA